MFDPWFSSVHSQVRRRNILCGGTWCGEFESQCFTGNMLCQTQLFLGAKQTAMPHCTEDLKRVRKRKQSMTQPHSRSWHARSQSISHSYEKLTVIFACLFTETGLHSLLYRNAGRKFTTGKRGRGSDFWEKSVIKRIYIQRIWRLECMGTI